MGGQRRNKPKEAASEPLHSPRAPQARRRRRATGAGELEMEESPREEAEKPGLPKPVGGGHLPGGARPYSPRRPRKLKAQNCMQMEVVTKTLFLQRFQFINSVLEQLRDKVHLLRRRQLSVRATVGMGEHDRQGGAPATAARPAVGLEGFGCVSEKIGLTGKPGSNNDRVQLRKAADKIPSPLRSCSKTFPRVFGRGDHLDVTNKISS